MCKLMPRGLPVIVGLAMALIASPAFAAATNYQQVLLSLIRPTAPTSFDISWYDNDTKTYYLADRTNKGIDVVDGRTDVFLQTYGGFAGPNGVTTIDHEVWAGDADSTVKVVSTRTGNITHTIPTNGKARADELADDPRDHLVMVANDNDSPPFVSFISTQQYEVVAKMPYDAPLTDGTPCAKDPSHSCPPAGHGFNATDGLEQPVWDDATHVFYFAVPATSADKTTTGEVDVVDPDLLNTKKSAVVNTYQVTNCHPQGLTLGPDSNLLVGCGGAASTHTLILNKRTGATVADIAQVHGSDEVWFNPGDRRYYLAASSCGCPGPVLGVIDARSNGWLANVTTQTGSHSVAANPESNQVYVPLNGKGIGIFMDITNLMHDHQG